MNTLSMEDSLIVLCKRFFCLLALLCLSFNISITRANPLDYRYPQSPKIQKFSLKDGLSQSVVNDIAQDPNGYIWLATEDGLNRFDSYEFRIFRHDYKDKSSLHENWIHSIEIDSIQGIWLGTHTGLSYYDNKENKFTDYSNQSSKLNSPIYALASTSNRLKIGGEESGAVRLKSNTANLDSQTGPKILLGNGKSATSFDGSKQELLWMGTSQGLYFLNKSTRLISRYLVKDGPAIDEEISSMFSRGSELFVGSASCLYKIDTVNDSVSRLCDRLETARLDFPVTSLFAENEELWIGTLTGLYRMNLNSYDVRGFVQDDSNRLSISSNNIQDIVGGQNNTIWIATSNGLNLFDKEKESFIHYSQQFLDDEGLSSNDVQSLLVDRESMVWAGTYGGGVNLLNPNQQFFEHIFTKNDVATLGMNNLVHSVELGRNEMLWIASYGNGLFYYNLMTGELSRFNFSKENYRNVYVYSLLIDRYNRLWVGTLEGLKLIDLDTNKEIKLRFKLDGEGIQWNSFVRRIVELSDGSIWFGSERGLHKLKELSQTSSTRAEVFLADLTPSLPKSFTDSSSFVSAIIEADNGSIWVGGYAGLLRYSREDSIWTHYQYDKNNIQSLSNNSVQAIFQDSSGSIWVGTEYGLNRVVSTKTNSQSDVFFERITRHEGLPNDSIYGILQDSKGRLWLSTNLGLAQYQAGNETLATFRQIDGLSSDEFNTNAYFEGHNGELIFGSINGLTKINVDQNRTTGINGLFHINKILVDGKPIDVEQVLASNIVSVGSPVYAVEVDVVNIAFNNFGSQQYRFKLDSGDTKWNYLGKNRRIFFNSLPAGSSVLTIQSRQGDSDWKENQIALELNVVSDFWNTPLGFVLLASFGFLLFGSSIWIVSNFYKSKLDRANKKSSIESLRGLELRTDIAGLKKSLAERDRHIQEVDTKLKQFQLQQLELENKDRQTGFFQYQFFKELLEEEQDKSHVKAVGKTDLENALGAEAARQESLKKTEFSNIFVIEITDFDKLITIHGNLVATEYMEMFSTLLKKEFSAGAFFIRYSQNTFIVLLQGNTGKKQLLKSRRLIGYVIKKLSSTVFNVANGLSVKPKYLFSIFEQQNNDLVKSNYILDVIDFVVSTHSFAFSENSNPKRVLADFEIIGLLADKNNTEISHLLSQLIADRLISFDELTIE